MSAKDCDHHHGHHKHRKLHRRIFFTVIFFILLILLTILIIWLVLRPSRPGFSLQDASISQLNFSSNGNNLLTSTLQVTLYSRNPNDRIGIYYDRLDTFISYKGQQITLATALPKGYQGHHDVSIWSPYLYGTDVPLAPVLMASLEQDENAGFLLLYVKVDGKLRWRVGSWMSGNYHLTVSCPAFFTFDALNHPNSFHFHQPTSCTVDV